MGEHQPDRVKDIARCQCASFAELEQLFEDLRREDGNRGSEGFGPDQTLSSLVGGQCGSSGGVSQPQVEARSVKIWVARATTGRASSAR